MAESAPNGGDDKGFPVTQWTIIVEAASANPERAHAALEKLCASYRQPIVNWFKRRDFRQDPEDLAHAFVAYLLNKGLLTKVVPRSRKFRAFLATCMKWFLRDSWDKLNTQKGGKDVEKVPLLDNVDTESDALADSQLDIEFAVEIHRRVMDQLQPDEALKHYIFEKDERWDEVAARLQTNAAALRQAVARLRRRHWELFRDEVGQMVTTREDKAEETRYLYELLFRNRPREKRDE